MSVFGPFIREVPARIGHNAALDAAVAVLVNAHTSLIHKKMSNEIVSPELYIRAIKTLQTSLEDPRQGLSTNTLCASVLLGLVEALAGPREGNRYLAHVGGAGRLMELQGPDKYQDPFAKEILRFNRGGIIITSIYERKPCFLVSPEWQDIAFDKTGLSFDDCLHTDLMQYMAELPHIFHDLKEINNRSAFPAVYDMTHDPALSNGLGEPHGEQSSDTCPSLDFSPDSFDSLEFLNRLQPVDTPPSISADAGPHSAARIALLHKVQDLKDALCILGTHMDAKLAKGATVCELPTIEEHSPIHTSYHFNNWRDMTAYNCFWSVLILTNKVMMRLLPPFDPAIYDLQSECRSIALEICKTWEDAWATKPIGAFHTGLSFVVAFEYCPPDVQDWIVRGLNSLLDYQMIDAFRWSEDVIAMMSSKLAGEGPDLVFSNMNFSKEAQ
ncbi:Nn.00g111070.m01.CDS01 [Neocucurbitaria sp. VM-36]